MNKRGQLKANAMSVCSGNDGHFDNCGLHHIPGATVMVSRGPISRERYGCI